MKFILIKTLLFSLVIMASCNQVPEPPAQKKVPVKQNIAKSISPTPLEIIAKKEVPVLCYHHIRNLKRKDSKRDQNDIISPAKFEKHIKMLSDSGYHSILPNELYDYLMLGQKLPEKPIMISFDDGYEEQFTIGASLLEKYGFKGVFFITTDAIGGRRMLKKAQIKNLSELGACDL